MGTWLSIDYYSYYRRVVLFTFSISGERWVFSPSRVRIGRALRLVALTMSYHVDEMRSADAIHFPVSFVSSPVSVDILFGRDCYGRRAWSHDLFCLLQTSVELPNR